MCVNSLIQEQGTPVYVYSGDKIATAITALISNSPQGVELVYSMKANPSVAVVQWCIAQGARVEVSSEGELAVIETLGVSAEQVMCLGPAKSDALIERCIKYGVGLMVLESARDLEVVEQYARKYQTRCAVLLRINPDFVLQGAAIKMGGVPTQFGLNQSAWDQHIPNIMRSKYLALQGIHVYNGSRALSESAIVENFTNILELARDCMECWQCCFKWVDIGGGLGIPYHDGEHPLDLNTIFSEIEPTLTALQAKMPGVRFLLESGRYCVGEAGSLYGTVLDIKCVHGATFAITDIGLHAHQGSTALGSVWHRPFPISVLGGEARPEACYHLSGPSCTPSDIWAKDIALPRLKVGDVICLHHVGAYGATASPSAFLSHGMPGECFTLGSQYQRIRDRQMPHDFLAGQHYLSLTEER